MKTKTIAVLFVAVAAFSATGCSAIASLAFGAGPVHRLVRVERDVKAPTQDGTLLAADVYHPRGAEPAPTILIRTPYGKHNPSIADAIVPIAAKMFAGHGYTVVVQDCRGRYGSEGDFYPFINEADDGRDTLAWTLDQPWSNHAVGAWGGSYFGMTQWAIADAPNGLDAFVPLITAADFTPVIYEGGAIDFANMLGWAAQNQGAGAQTFSPQTLAAAAWTLPIIDADNALANDTIPFFDDVVTYQILDRLAPLDYKDRYANVSAPALSIGGWYDLFTKAQIEDMARLHTLAQEPARSESKLIFGPWGHGFFVKPPIKFHDGAIARFPALDKVVAWFDHYLKGENNGVENWPNYQVYVMGANVWRGYDQWPPQGVQPTPFFLHSGGDANSKAGDGALSTDPPGDQPADHFVYDPLNPVPTTGGPLLGQDLGPKNQAPVEARDDVLIYSSPVLDQPLTIMGPIKLVLYAATDGPDTDFTAKLCDVYPNGLSVNITDGIIRGRFRAGDLKNPELLEPGQIYRLEIDLWHTAIQFQPGHRIRVQISSSNFPRFDRNLNTGLCLATSSSLRPAHQTVLHDSNRQSYLLLPVAPPP